MLIVARKIVQTDVFSVSCVSYYAGKRIDATKSANSVVIFLHGIYINRLDKLIFLNVIVILPICYLDT